MVRERKLRAGKAASGEAEIVAREAGMHPDHLLAFNADGPVDGAWYVPSAEEILFHQAADLATFDELCLGPNVALLTAARHRARGRVGLGYGTEGADGGWFYSPNPGLDGASRRRREVLDGVAEYRIMWAPSFWRCSVFMNDVIHQAGWQSDLTANKHYRLAGQIHTSRVFAATAPAPGVLFQKFGGAGSDESHNAILSTFVAVTPVDETTEDWSFMIVGAEQEQARENPRSYRVKKGTSETIDGKVLRFFRPRYKR